MIIVFDTSAWIEYFLDSKNAGIVEKYLNENEIITPSIVLLELSYRADREKWNFKDIINFVKTNSTIQELSEEFLLKFGRIYNESKKKVRDISIADCFVLTCAKLSGAQLLTLDNDFSRFEEAIVLK